MRKGFTLVEIMIVVAIIALLAAIAIPNLLRARVTANEAAAQATLRAISTAFETYAVANNGTYPDSVTEDLYNVTPKYLNKDYIADSPVQGYNYACTAEGGGALDGTGYSCTATPATCGTTGTKTYTITTGGILSEADCAAGEAGEA